jgi:hypothetical protein
MRLVFGAALAAILAASPSAWSDEGGMGMVSLFANVGKWSSGDTGGDGSQALVYSQVAYDAKAWGVAATGSMVQTSYKSSTLQERLDISTLTDTAIATHYGMKWDEATLRLGLDVNLPTGKHAYSDSEINKAILEDVSQDLLLVNVYGAGLNIAPHVLASYRTGFGAVGAGLKYSFAGEFDPTTERSGDNFDPGDKLMAVMTAMILSRGEDYVLLNASYTRAGIDKQGGRDVFHTGDLYGADARYVAKWDGNSQTALAVSLKWQNKNELLDAFGALRPEMDNSNKNSTEVLLNNSYRYTSEVTVTGVAGYKTVAANGYPANNGLYDAGRNKYYIEPGAAWQFSKEAYLSGKLRYSMVKDKQDAFSAVDATYNVYNLDLGVVYTF